MKRGAQALTDALRDRQAAGGDQPDTERDAESGQGVPIAKGSFRKLITGVFSAKVAGMTELGGPVRKPFWFQDAAGEAWGAGAAAAAAMVLGPSFLAACSKSDNSSGSASGPAAPSDDGKPATGKLRISNWPLYMADGFIAAFQTATGLTVDYKEDFNDNEEWFAKNKEPLSRKQDIGADLVVPTQFMAARLNGLGWLNGISETRWTNKKNLRPDLLDDGS